MFYEEALTSMCCYYCGPPRQLQKTIYRISFRRFLTFHTMSSRAAPNASFIIFSYFYVTLNAVTWLRVLLYLGKKGATF
ncbi:hypothetical protein NC653_017672 [Populus alba x Populus x berolinensis]|uniref:Uncharacterized protein n=1 Tax=Populus alba x Populus x berolinensis TaxID=444605 RepID=A0AAD6QQV1_9ROSI|nr:hypothetical protein NC653_017672 [Populus alba x Populus x berolinensis]